MFWLRNRSALMSISAFLLNYWVDAFFVRTENISGLNRFVFWNFWNAEYSSPQFGLTGTVSKALMYIRRRCVVQVAWILEAQNKDNKRLINCGTINSMVEKQTVIHAFDPNSTQDTLYSVNIDPTT